MPDTKPKLRFSKSDKDVIAEKICDCHSKRKNDRRVLERQWSEIDRQLEMDPAPHVKKERQGEREEATAWMAETELPSQSETLEISTADARRLMMPKGVDWFAAHAALTDDYLEKVDYQSLIAGDKNDVPSKITQDNADKLVQGLMAHWHNQYDFKGNVDSINSEAFKYSMGIGRARQVEKRVFAHTDKGVQLVKHTIPILVPRSIKNTYLDSTEHTLSNEGFIVAPGQIFETALLAKDLMMASQRGSSSTEDMNGGWIKGALKGFDEDKEVQILEWEGDMVVARKSSGSHYLANSIISVAVGHSGKDSIRSVFRIRKNNMPWTSYILFPYYKEHIDSPYGTSPLMKGRPVQMAATESLNRLMELGALQTQPPVSRDGDMQGEDPKVHPGAIWDEGVKPHDIGNPQAMLAVYSSLLSQYSDVTGTTAARLGQQTVSHTTAYSKEAELARGQIRINHYTDATLEGALERWLHMEYHTGRENMGEELFYIRPYGGFVKAKKSLLPDHVEFEAYGSGQPADENARNQKRFAALQMAIQIDQMLVSTGQPPKLDLGSVIEQVLMEGSWTDIDQLMSKEAIQGIEPNPGLQVAAQQGLSFGN